MGCDIDSDFIGVRIGNGEDAIPSFAAYFFELGVSNGAWSCFRFPVFFFGVPNLYRAGQSLLPPIPPEKLILTIPNHQLPPQLQL